MSGSNTIPDETLRRYLATGRDEALPVVRAAVDLTGDLNKAVLWYRNERLPAFGYKTEERLVSEGRAHDLVRYVTSLEAAG